MNAEDIATAIISTTYTTADLHRRLRLLRQYFEKKFFTSGPKLAIADFINTQEEVGEGEADIFVSFGDEFYSSFTKETCYKLLDNVAGTAKKMPTVRLNLSFDPPSGEVAKLGTWFRQNLPVSVLIDLKIDADAFGGCTFAWDGKFQDYSLRYYLARSSAEIVSFITTLTGTSSVEGGDGQPIVDKPEGSP